MIDQLIEHRQQQDTRKIRDHQTNRYGERLIVEDRAGDTAHKDQRDEHGNGRQCRTEHWRDHLGRAAGASLLQALPLRPVLRNVLRHDNRTVDHHTQRQDQAGERDDIQRHIKQVEKEETGDDTHRHAQPDHDRAPHIAQEKDRDNKDEEETKRQVLLQVRDRIVEQFGLVARDRELNIGIDLREIIGHLSQGLFHVGHVLVGLLDDREGNGPLAIRKGITIRLARHHLNLGQILELIESVVAFQVNIPDIIRRTEQRRDLDIILIIAVANRQVARLHVVGRQGLLQVGLREVGHPQFLHVGRDA